MKKQLSKTIIFLIIILIGTTILPFSKCNAGLFKLLKGNHAYKEGYYADALNIYKSEITRNTDNNKAIFNAANSLYKLENYTKAIDYYRRALLNSKNKKIRTMIYYNMGNSFFKLGNYEEAMKDYLKALELEPYNVKIKQNLEITAEKLKKAKNKGETPSPSQHGKNTNDKMEKPQMKEEKKSKNETPTTKPENQKTGKALTEEEVKKILRSLEEKDQYQLQRIIKNRLEKETNNENGW